MARYLEKLFYIVAKYQLMLFMICRGGVLEPEGTVEIKYRRRDQQKTMWRIDPLCRQIVEKLNNPQISEDEHKELALDLKRREDLLLPMYHQVAVHFADLHDTPGRMEAVEVISVSYILLCTFRIAQINTNIN